MVNQNKYTIKPNQKGNKPKMSNRKLYTQNHQESSLWSYIFFLGKKKETLKEK